MRKEELVHENLVEREERDVMLLAKLGITGQRDAGPQETCSGTLP